MNDEWFGGNKDSFDSSHLNTDLQCTSSDHCIRRIHTMVGASSPGTMMSSGTSLHLLSESGKTDYWQQYRSKYAMMGLANEEQENDGRQTLEKQWHYSTPSGENSKQHIESESPQAIEDLEDINQRTTSTDRSSDSSRHRNLSAILNDLSNAPVQNELSLTSGNEISTTGSIVSNTACLDLTDHVQRRNSYSDRYSASHYNLDSPLEEVPSLSLLSEDLCQSIQTDSLLVTSEKIEGIQLYSARLSEILPSVICSQQSQSSILSSQQPSVTQLSNVDKIPEDVKSGSVIDSISQELPASSQKPVNDVPVLSTNSMSSITKPVKREEIKTKVVPRKKTQKAIFNDYLARTLPTESHRCYNDDLFNKPPESMLMTSIDGARQISLQSNSEEQLAACAKNPNKNVGLAGGNNCDLSLPASDHSDSVHFSLHDFTDLESSQSTRDISACDLSLSKPVNTYFTEGNINKSKSSLSCEDDSSLGQPKIPPAEKVFDQLQSDRPNPRADGRRWSSDLGFTSKSKSTTPRVSALLNNPIFQKYLNSTDHTDKTLKKVSVIKGSSDTRNNFDLDGHDMKPLASKSNTEIPEEEVFSRFYNQSDLTSNQKQKDSLVPKGRKPMRARPHSFSDLSMASSSLDLSPGVTSRFFLPSFRQYKELKKTGSMPSGLQNLCNDTIQEEDDSDISAGGSKVVNQHQQSENDTVDRTMPQLLLEKDKLQQDLPSASKQTLKSMSEGCLAKLYSEDKNCQEPSINSSTSQENWHPQKDSNQSSHEKSRSVSGNRKKKRKSGVLPTTNQVASGRSSSDVSEEIINEAKSRQRNKKQYKSDPTAESCASHGEDRSPTGSIRKTSGQSTKEQVLDFLSNVDREGISRSLSSPNTNPSQMTDVNNLEITSQKTSCEDCSTLLLKYDLDYHQAHMLNLCAKCEARRGERKEVIQEIVDTEVSYGKDLKVIKEEFYVPMQLAGLLSADQLESIFSNLNELIAISDSFSDQLLDALDSANELGDEDYMTVHLGELFLQSANLFLAFETYCINQVGAPIYLEQLEREKELFRVFLQVSERENSVLRRMGLKAFLMAPVQRIMRYRLLLVRLFDLTTSHHPDRDHIHRAMRKIENILTLINTKSTKGSMSLRIRNRFLSKGRPPPSCEDIELHKVAMETVGWKRKDVSFLRTGRLLYTQPVDHLWSKRAKFNPLYAIAITLNKDSQNELPDKYFNQTVSSNHVIETCVVLVREKAAKYTLIRDPLYLSHCVVFSDPEMPDVFEILDMNKETFILKGEHDDDTDNWFKLLKQHSRCLGQWRKRRNALANIMIQGSIRT